MTEYKGLIQKKALHNVELKDQVVNEAKAYDAEVQKFQVAKAELDELLKRVEAQKGSMTGSTGAAGLLKAHMQTLEEKAQVIKNEYKANKDFQEYIEKYNKIMTECCRCKIVLDSIPH